MASLGRIPVLPMQRLEEEVDCEKGRVDCLYTNKSLLKDQFVISGPCLDWGFALITGMG